MVGLSLIPFQHPLHVGDPFRTTGALEQRGEDNRGRRSSFRVGLMKASPRCSSAHDRRRLASAVRRATSGNHRVLTDAVRDHDMPTSQAETLEARAELRALADAYRTLSPLEQRAMSAIASGRPASSVGSTRQVDNAVQRARRKLRQAA